jgi:hypothetical protein
MTTVTRYGWPLLERQNSQHPYNTTVIDKHGGSNHNRSCLSLYASSIGFTKAGGWSPFGKAAVCEVDGETAEKPNQEWLSKLSELPEHSKKGRNIAVFRG